MRVKGGFNNESKVTVTNSFTWEIKVSCEDVVYRCVYTQHITLETMETEMSVAVDGCGRGEVEIVFFNDYLLSW